MNNIKILFVCMGNICRSPSAETIFKQMCSEKGLKIYSDSAGIINYHEGEPSDLRMREHALRRGYNITSVSRQIRQSDFYEFDMIIGMDDSNVSDLLRLAVSDEQRAKISKMTDYSKLYESNSVPDPYYGGSKGFELVLDMLEDACLGLIEKISHRS